MRFAFRLLGLIAVLVLTSAGAKFDRIALVIGNSDYSVAGRLANPANDAQDVAAKLRKMGFEVIDGYDLGKRAMEQKIGEFANQLDGASTGLFYFAGHGIAVNGRNFVLPVDARLDTPAKLKLEALPADDIVELMGHAVKTSVVILDACRNNPFARSLSQGATTRGIQSAEGLTGMEAATGAFIAFSTKPGYVALDGTGRNSPFAEALLKHMDTPGLTISEMMRRVRNDVVETTQDFQRPQWDDDLSDAISLMPGTAPDEPASPEPEPVAVARAEDASIATFISERYLKPRPDDFETSLKELFAAEVTSFGYLYTRDSLIAAKATWFGAYEKWDLRLTPGTLHIEPMGEAAATARFDMTYSYWPKQGGAVVEGRTRVTLGLVRDGAEWRINAETSAVVP